jgi:hypothetical protein
MKNVIQENQAIAKFDRRRPEFRGRKSLAESRIVQFREMKQRWLTAADEFQAGALHSAAVQRNPASQ